MWSGRYTDVSKEEVITKMRSAIKNYTFDPPRPWLLVRDGKVTRLQ